MPLVKEIIIRESVKELRAFQKTASSTVYKRLLMLIAIKQNKGTSTSKRVLSVQCGIDANSVTAWKKLYEQSGIDGIINDGRKGFKPSLISNENHLAIEKKLNDPQNGLRGYIELQDWIMTTLSLDLKYITVLKYAKRHFGTKIKVARKSHIKKDEAAVEDLKKTLVESARK